MFQDDRFDRLLEQYIAAAEQIGRHLEQIENILRDARPIHVVIDNWPTQTPPPTTGAVKAVLTFTGADMPAGITVDSNSNAILNYTDDKGDPTAAPAGATAVFASDNAAVATLGASVSTATGFSAPAAFVAEGTFNLSVAQTGAFEADGTTAIADPAPELVTVTAGPANTAALSIA